MLIGDNLRAEAAVMNARLRKSFVAGGLKIASIGPKVEFTFPVQNLGAGPQTLAEVAEGRHPFFETLKAATKPMLSGCPPNRSDAALERVVPPG